MNRRNVLVAGGGTVVALTGGAAVANATRADLLADSELTRGEGEAVERARTITRDSVEYLESTNDVRENDTTQPFAKWAQRECTELGAKAILGVVEKRFEKPVEGVGSGVRHLLFGPVITVDHTVTRGRDGSVVSEPNVALDRLISVTPRTITVTVSLKGEGNATAIPVGVGHREVSPD